MFINLIIKIISVENFKYEASHYAFISYPVVLLSFIRPDIFTDTLFSTSFCFEFELPYNLFRTCNLVKEQIGVCTSL